MTAAPDTGVGMDALLAAMRRAELAEGLPGVAQRRARLAALGAALRRHREDLAGAISADFGNRSRPETMLAEVVPVLGAIAHATRHVAAWMRPQRRRVPLTMRPAAAVLRHDPLGVVGIMAPWNYPVLLGLMPLVDALAAGNRALLKPSELAPATAALLARVLGEAFAPDVVAVVQGGRDVGEAFARLPLDHLVFTGSTAVGRAVMAAAAERLTPVTLELGGKSPVVVCEGFDLARAARILVAGKLFNAGQTCIAPDYVLAPAAVAGQLAELVAAEALRLFPRLAGNPDYTAIVSRGHYDRLAAALARDAAAGARVLRHPEGDVPAERRLAPAVVLDAPEGGALLGEEIFGPVLPILGVRDLDAAIAHVRARPHPLALYVLGEDRAAVARVLDGTRSGGVAVNATLLQGGLDDLPFGGVGPSGTGAYHGHAGFARLSHARGVFRGGRVSGFLALVPPHGRGMRALLRVLLR